MMCNNMCDLIKHTYHSNRVGRLQMQVIYQWNMYLNQEEIVPFIYVSYTGLGWRRGRSEVQNSHQTEDREEIDEN